MAEKLCQKFGNGPHALKIGKSFEKKGGNSVYHSIRYDFTPKSIDKETMGVLEVKERQSVSVQLPHSDGVGQTNYKGNAETAATKDCVLIIDHETGELTLERISNKIMVKKTRLEKAGAPPPLPQAGNPYEVKTEPNPYEVKPTPSFEKASGRSGQERQRTSNTARPTTPQQPQQKKKSPGYQLTESLSPLHSNKSSPASTSGRGPSSQGYNVDTMGRPLSSSSDSNSSSDSDSDVDDPKPPKPPKTSKPAPAPSTLSMPGDLGDLLSGEVTPRPGGTLPTARPGKTSSSNSRPSSTASKQRAPGRGEGGPPPSYPSQPPAPPPPRPAPAPPPAMPAIGMPDIFGDLGDDLELSDDSE